MCGIFGYVGSKTNAAQIVLEGLKLLEYRGYDSWGVAVKVQSSKFSPRSTPRVDAGEAGKVQSSDRKNRFIVEKYVGKIGNAHLKNSDNHSQLAIGHTRWATHGGVTVANAHPHLDCKKQIAVVHNGIIENFIELKKELIQLGHTFKSETDTEVFAHLVEENLKHGGFATSVRKAFNKLKGMNAVVVANAVSSEIVAAKTGSPLVVGRSNGNLYIASDAAGIVRHTKDVIFLKDNQMVILGKHLKLISLPGGLELKPKFHKLDWKFEDATKGEHKHFLIKEISEQPHVIENIAINYDQDTQKLANLIDKAFGTFMLGCGTASYAALSGVYLFSKIAKKHVNFSIGSEFNYLEDYLTPKSLVIPISQSGETIDVVGPVESAKKKGSKIAAIVNVLGSTLYRQANYRVLLGAGQEKAVIGTKTFTAMFSVLLLSAYTLAKKQNECKELLLRASQSVKEILQESYQKKIKDLAGKIKNKEHVYIIGRGLSYSAALECTLKIKETCYIHAEGFAGGELKHGVIALIEKNTPCIVIAPNDETFDDVISNAQEIKARGGWIIGIGPKENQVFDTFLKTSDVREATLIPQVVISQLLAYHTALKKGFKDPDKPRNLAKSVTVK